MSDTFVDAARVGPPPAFDRELPQHLLAALELIDPRAQESVKADFEAALAARTRLTLASNQQVVLVGHRAAGKSRLLSLMTRLLERAAVDLDRELETRHQRPLGEWVSSDPGSFRIAEREIFKTLPCPRVVAVGGGFLSHHAQLLEPHVAVEIPVTFRTYRERLLEDTTRPRLRPELSLEEEIRQVYRAREFAHRAVSRWTLGAFLAALPHRSSDVA